MLGSVSEAEDVVSDAFLRLAQAGQQPIESSKAYLATITTRLAIDQLRSARARRELRRAVAARAAAGRRPWGSERGRGRGRRDLRLAEHGVPGGAGDPHP